MNTKAGCNEWACDNFDALFNFTMSGVASYCLQGNTLKVVYFSEGLAKAIGYTQEEYMRIASKNALDLICEEDRAQIWASIQEAVQNNKPIRASFRVVAKTGALVWVNVNGIHAQLVEGHPSIENENRLVCKDGTVKWIGQLLENEDSSPYFYCVFVDISRQKEEEQRVADVRKNLMIAMKHARMTYWEYDFEQCTASANECTQRNFGMPSMLENYPESFLKMGFVFEKHVPIFRKNIYAMRDGAEYTEFTIKLRTLETDYSWMKLRFTGIKDDSGRPVRAVCTAEEVTEFKELEERFQTTLTQNHILTFEVDQNSMRIENLNGFSEKFMHMAADGDLTVDVFCSETASCSCIHRDQWAEFKAMFRRVCQSEETASMEAQVYYFNVKKYLWSYLTVSRERDHVHPKLLCTARIIHEEKMAEIRYREELKIRDQVDESIIASCIVNLSQNVVEDMTRDRTSVFKKNMAHLTDFSVYMAQLFQSPQISAQDSGKFSADYLLRQYQLGVNCTSLEFLANSTSNGQELWVRADCRMYTRPDNHDVIAVFYCYDVTSQYMSRQMMLNAFRNSYENAGLLYAKSGNIRLFDQNAQAIRASEHAGQYEEIFAGYLKRVLPAHHTPERRKKLQDENRIAWIIQKLNDQPVYVSTFDVSTSSGEVRRKEIRYSYADKARAIICVMKTDVTELVTAELQRQAQLELALETAEKANMAKSEFLSTMSHEIRTPMNVILGLTALAQKDVTDAKVVDGYLTNISITSKHLMSLINNILDMSRIEKGEMVLHPDSYTYEEFKEYLSAVIEPLCQQKGVRLIERDESVHHAIFVDKLRFNQVLFNILSNAIKFTPQGGTIYFTYHNELRNDHMKCRFEVTDTGVGMTEEFQRRLFQPFTQEDNGVLTAVQGTGLGMALSKGIVERMGGSIACSSKRGHGTTFVLNFTFPLTDHAAETQAQTMNPMGSFEGKKILVVEDHPMNRLIVRKLLVSKKASVHMVENGKQAVAFFKKSEPYAIDAILMDIRMPVMDGLEATARIRALHRSDAKTVPIIAMTANAYDSDSEKSRQAGMNCHLSKPIEPQLLYKTLESFLYTEKSVSQPPEDQKVLAPVGEETTVNPSEAAQLENQPMNFFGFAIYKLLPSGAFEVRYCSEDVPKWTGYTMSEYEERMRTGITGIYEPDEFRASNTIKQCLKQKESFDLSYRLQHKNGHVMWLHVIGRYLGEENGYPLLLSVFQNLDLQYSPYHQLLDGADQAFIISDTKEHTVLYANKKALEMFGLSADTDCRGMTCHSLFMGRSAPCEICKMAAAMKLGECRDQFRYNNKEIVRTSMAIRLENKSAVMEYLTDITPQIEEQQNQNQLMSELKLAVQELSELCLVVNVTKNTMRELRREDCTLEGIEENTDFDASFINGAQTVHPDDRAAFIAAFSRENLMRAHAEGKTKVIVRHKSRGLDGFWHQMETTAVFMPVDESGDVREMSFTRQIGE